MKFSKTSEYAIRVLVYIANQGGTLVSVKHLHQKLDIPYKYLARLMSNLNKVGYVSVQRGKHGGYKIAGNTDDLYLYQIIESVEGLENFHQCLLGFPDCSCENPCPIHKFWIESKAKIYDMLQNVSLSDLVQSSGNI